MKQIKLYEWQKEAKARFLASEGKALIKASTGSGKTIFAIDLMQELFEQNKVEFAIILVPTSHLLDQWYDELLNFYPRYQLSRKGGGHNQTISLINIWINNTARKVLPPLWRVKDFFLIVDECHKVASPKNAEMLSTVNPDYKLGLSATPQPFNIRQFGAILFEYNFKDGIRDGVIHDVNVINIGYDMAKDEQAEYDNFTKRKKTIEKHLGVVSPSPHQINRLMSSGAPEIRALCQSWQNVCIERKRGIFAHSTRLKLTLEVIHRKSTRKILVVGESIIAVELIYAALSDTLNEGIGIEHSKMHQWDRDLNINRFKDGVTRIMVSARTLDTGANFPEVDMVVIHSSSSNPLQFIQRIGRGVRRAGAPITLVFRPFTIGTSDDLAIDNLISADVLDRDCIESIHWPDGHKIINTPRSELIRLSLLSSDHVKTEHKKVFRPPSGLAKAVRSIKPKGGVFYYHPDSGLVRINVDGTWYDVGQFDMNISLTEPIERNFSAPMTKAYKTEVLDFLAKFTTGEEE